MTPELKTKNNISALLLNLYEEIGGDREHIAQILPNESGRWDDSLWYEVATRDNRTARVYRKEIDDDNFEGIKAALLRLVRGDDIK